MAQASFRELLTTHFNLSDLQDLCHDLGIEYEELEGQTLSAKARALIAWCFRHGLVPTLLEACRKARPHVSWPAEQEVLDAYNRASRRARESQQPVEAVATLLQRGVQLIETRAFDQAIELLESAIRSEPTLADAHYYLAMALLRGKRPKLLSLSTIRSAEEHLRTAIALDADLGAAYVLWSLVKYDYYVLNGMFDRPPSYQDLLGNSRSLTQAHAQEIVKYVNAEGNPVWDWLWKTS